MTSLGCFFLLLHESDLLRVSIFHNRVRNGDKPVIFFWRHTSGDTSFFLLFLWINHISHASLQGKLGNIYSHSYVYNIQRFIYYKKVRTDMRAYSKVSAIQNSQIQVAAIKSDRTTNELDLWLEQRWRKVNQPADICKLSRNCFKSTGK